MVTYLAIIIFWFIQAFIKGDLDMRLQLSIWRINVSGVLLFFIFRMKKDLLLPRYYIKVIFISSIIVAAIYGFEFYKINIIRTGPMDWYINYSNYHIAKIENSGGAIVSGVSTFYSVMGLYFYRISGIIGHHHATALYVYIGAIISLLYFFQKNKKIQYSAIFIFLLLIGIISFNRTAPIAFIVTLSIILTLFYNKGHYVVYTIIGILITIITFSAILPLGDLILVYFSPKYMVLIFDQIFDYIEQLSTNPLLFLTGNGFAVDGNVPYFFKTILSEDTFIIQLISQFGIFFILFLFVIIIENKKIINTVKKVGGPYFTESVILYSFILMIIVSMGHSSVFYRYVIYDMFFISLALLLNQKSFINNLR